MNVAGLPVHALVVHAAVVLTPLAIALVAAFALLPRWRWLIRWPAALAAVAATGSVLLAKLSGDALLEDRPFLLQSQQLATKIELHQQRGGVLVWLMVGFLLLALVGAWALGGPSGLTSGRGAQDSRVPALDVALPVVLVIASAVVLVWVVLTGDAGARAVWEQ
jgi:hypothetical protein